eukprot:1188639-Prorocentrum_minimum.AAC.1
MPHARPSPQQSSTHKTNIDSPAKAVLAGKQILNCEKGTPVGVVYRAQGPALGSWDVQPPAACYSRCSLASYDDARRVMMCRAIVFVATSGRWTETRRIRRSRAGYWGRRGGMESWRGF